MGPHSLVKACERSTHLAVPENLDSDREDTGCRGWLGLRCQHETGGPLWGQGSHGRAAGREETQRR